MTTSTASAVADSRPPRCIHCSSPIPAGRTSTFCCGACEIVFGTISSLGLRHYYQLRDENAEVSRRPASAIRRDFAYFDEPSFLEQYTTNLPDNRSHRQVTFFLEGIHCAACIWILEKLPQLNPGIHSARVAFSRSVVQVDFDSSTTSLAAIASLLYSLGYTPAPIREGDGLSQRRRSHRAALIRIGIAGFCAMNVMMLALSVYQGHYTGIEAEYERLFSRVSFLLTLPVVAYAALPFYRTALGGLRSGILHIDLPIVAAILVAFLYSAFNTIVGVGSIYYDSICALVLLLLVGRLLQQRSVERVLDASNLLYALSPRSARLKSQAREVFVESLPIDTEVTIADGETIPVDGVITEGRGHVSTAVLTGESTPHGVSTGARVFAGTRLLNGALTVRVSATGTASRLGRLMTSIEQSARRRAPLELFLDRVSRGFVAVVLVMAAGTFWWWWSVAGLPEAFEYSVALLVVSCPCVLAVATPLTFSLAIAEAARQGILIKNPEILERLTSIRTLCLDKTGTLTRGEMTPLCVAFRAKDQTWHLQELHSTVAPPRGDSHLWELVGIAQSLEADSFHPIAAAVRALPYAAQPPAFSTRRTIPGVGVEGVLLGETWRMQSPREVTSAEVNHPTLTAVRARVQGASEAFLCRNGDPVLWLAAADSLRPESADVIMALKRHANLTVEILSGDTASIVREVASALGVTSARGGMTPEEKRQHVADLERRAPTAMVGDGVNDAPALAACSVGIGVHGGAEVCLAVADVYLSSPGLSPLLTLFRGAHRTLRVVKGSLLVSVLYNILAAGAALGGMIGPLHAAIIMPLSSLSTVGFALISKKFRS